MKFYTPLSIIGEEHMGEKREREHDGMDMEEWRDKRTVSVLRELQYRKEVEMTDLLRERLRLCLVAREYITKIKEMSTTVNTEALREMREVCARLRGLLLEFGDVEGVQECDRVLQSLV